MSIRRRILWGTLAVALITLVAGILGAAAIRRDSREAAQEELFRQAEVTAQLVRSQIAALPQGASADRPLINRVRRVLEEVKVIGGHDFLEVALVNARGRLVELVDDPKLLPLLREELDREVRTVTVDGERVIATFRSISVGQGGDGPVRLVVAIGRFDTFVIGAVITRTLLFALLIGTIAAVVLALGLSRTLGGRLEGLASAAKSYAEGDFDSRVEVSGDDEVAAVGIAFNEMAGELDGLRKREREFLMSVGHDLRTPLTTIRGYAEGLDSGTFGAGDLARVAGVLHDQTDRLSRLVEDVMLLARVQSREFALRPEPVDLAAHVGGVVEAFRVRADAAEVGLVVGLQDVGVVEIDPDRVDQVVTNLLDNALRYTPSHGTVEVRLEAVGKSIRLTVSDTGPGIDPEDLPHVFERLYVAQRYRAVRSEGSGLGLSIVGELARAMGGDASVTSVPGEGTSVVVTFGA